MQFTVKRERVQKENKITLYLPGANGSHSRLVNATAGRQTLKLHPSAGCSFFIFDLGGMFLYIVSS